MRPIPRSRRTRQRTAIEAAFGQTSDPLAIEQVLHAARALVPTLDLATVYRNLNRMVADGQLVRIAHPGLGTLYEQAGKHHHHHFYCRKCRSLRELPGCALDHQALAPSGYHAEGHELFLHGICGECSRR